MRPLSSHVIAAAAILLMPHSAPAADVQLVVPTQYATIQAALDDAVTLTQNNPANSYSVLVEPGTYPGGIQLRSGIPLRGRETARTILNGGSGGRAIVATGVTSVSVRNFTFRASQIGVLVTNGASGITITNNAFFLGPGGTGVQVDGGSSARVVNNTLYGNGIGVYRDSTNTDITNNIFSNNTIDIQQLSAFTDQSRITYNFYQPVPLASDITGTFYLPNASFPDPDPLFVSTSQADFHLTSGSPGIDRGDPSILDSTQDGGRSDMGSYGGPNTDTIPMPVTGLSATATSTTAVSISWAASADYRVNGYRVHYGTSGNFGGTDAAEGPSPLNAGTALNFSLTSLATGTIAVSAPVLAAPSPRNGALVLSWNAVPSATFYTVHYGTTATTEHAQPVGNTTSYTLGGLTNGQTYRIAVTSAAQSTYHVAVTAVSSTGASQVPVPGTAYESAYASATVQVGPVSESGPSNEVIGMPESLVPYPSLPNNGCFIATAAYGSADAPAVRVLRAFRDRWLQTTSPGRAFVRWYYQVSPAAARFLNDHPSLKPFARAALAPVVAAAYVLEAPVAIRAMLLLVVLMAGTVMVRRRNAA